eukprot:9062970-Pyramimonas_sp.AAC.1
MDEGVDTAYFLRHLFAEILFEDFRPGLFGQAILCPSGWPQTARRCTIYSPRKARPRPRSSAA